MTVLVKYHPTTVRKMLSSYGTDVTDAIQRGPCDYIWLMAMVAAEESGLEGAASSLVYVRDYETEVFFFSLDVSNEHMMTRRFIYNGEDFYIRSERVEPEGEEPRWEKFPVEGDGLTGPRREEIMLCFKELCEAQITFLTPTGMPSK